MIRVKFSSENANSVTYYIDTDNFEVAELAGCELLKKDSIEDNFKTCSMAYITVHFIK